MRVKIPYLPLHTASAYQKNKWYCCNKLKYLSRRKNCLLILVSLCFMWLIFVHYYNFLFSIFYCVSFIQLESIPDHLAPIRIKTVNSRVPLCSLFKEYKSTFHVNESAIKKLDIQQGGMWEPIDCVPQHHVAIVIPYRDRETQLNFFLNYMHQFLQNQFISYQIFIIEQSKNKEFNRGKLLNIGYLEATKIRKVKCFIFHDVDLLPVNPNNIYACTKQPRHMSVAIDVFDYQLPYCTIFGGAIAIKAEQFQMANGFSNLYFGWGAEDDDFFQRLSNYYSICRFSKKVSEYVMLEHKKQSQSNSRLLNLKTGSLRYRSDGLNSLTQNYTVINCTALPLETRIVVDI